MNTMAGRLLLIGVLVAASNAAVYLWRRRFDYRAFEANIDFTHSMYSMISLVYGVFLAFTIIVVWQQFSAAEEVATAEATHLSELWRDAETFGPVDRGAIHERLLAYADSLIRAEWPAMAATHQAAPETSEAYERLWMSYYAVQLDPANLVQRAFYEETVRRLNDLGMLRRRRLLAAGSELPGLMWILLLAGGLIMVAFAFLFGARQAAIQYLLISVVTGMVSFSILMVAAMQHPFSGDVSIKPDTYQGVLDSMKARAARRALAPQ